MSGLFSLMHLAYKSEGRHRDASVIATTKNSPEHLGSLLLSKMHPEEAFSHYKDTEMQWLLRERGERKEKWHTEETSGRTVEFTLNDAAFYHVKKYAK